MASNPLKPDQENLDSPSNPQPESPQSPESRLENFADKLVKVIIEGISKVPQADFGMDIPAANLVLQALHDKQITLSEFASIDPTKEHRRKIATAMHGFHTKYGIPVAMSDAVIEEVRAKITDSIPPSDLQSSEPLPMIEEKKVFTSRIESFVSGTVSSVLKIVGHLGMNIHQHNIASAMTLANSRGISFDPMKFSQLIEAQVPSLINDSLTMQALCSSFQAMVDYLNSPEGIELAQSYKDQLSSFKNKKYTLDSYTYGTSQIQRMQYRRELENKLQSVFAETLKTHEGFKSFPDRFFKLLLSQIFPVYTHANEIYMQ